MKQLFPVLALLFLGCTVDDDSSVDLSSKSRIARIENSLTPVLQIEGQEKPTYNINVRLEELGIPGLSVAFAVNGAVRWSKAYGMADVSDRQPVSTDTMFLAGSISKPVAAVRAHQLVEEGTFDLDEDINNYLTSWQVPENEFTAKEKVTLRRILNHTAGLTVWGFPGYDKGDDIPGVVDVLEGRGNTDPVRVFREPGKAWLYSGGGYTVMQLAIADKEGVAFPETMQRNVLDRMNMQGSTFENPLPAEYHALAATGYRVNGDEVEGNWPIYPEMAAAGLWTTPGELIQYAIEVQRILQSGQDGILKHGTVVEMLVAGEEDWGLGPEVTEHTFRHGGSDEGFRASLIAWQEEPYAAVVMVNSDNGSIIGELLLSIAKEYGLPDIEPVVRELIVVGQEVLERYVGRYETQESGPVEISLINDHLSLYLDDWDERFIILPQTESQFFHSVNGSLVDFDVKNGVVYGFEWQGERAERVN
ncbi:MAG: serine hydrolase [Gammaproteobacteria bacterium]|nr:serine hydrolase [Gammaproteobacteria bacterium]